jgi:hypothetical protein
MLELEETFYASRIHIIGDGRAAKRNCLPKDALQAGVKAIKFCPLQVVSHPAGPDPCPEKTLVSINIPHAMQELLIEQGSFDGCATRPEKRGELVTRNIERLLAGPGEALRLLCGDPMELQTPEAPRVDKAQLSPGGQMQDAMRMPGNRGCRIGDQQPPGHAQVHDPLQPRMLRPGGGRPVCQVEDDVFAHAMDAVDAPPGQFLCHYLRRRLEGLRFLAEPGGFDAVSAKALIDPACDSFDLRQFRHGFSAFIVAEGRRVLGRYPAPLYDLELDELSRRAKLERFHDFWAPSGTREVGLFLMKSPV